MYENSISVFCKASRLALEPTQSYIQVLEAIHLHLEPRLRMGGAIPPVPFMPSWHREGHCFGGTCCIHLQVDQNMEAACPCETSIHFTRLQKYNIPEDHSLSPYRKMLDTFTTSFCISPNPSFTTVSCFMLNNLTN